jgi:hypothetical protein
MNADQTLHWNIAFCPIRKYLKMTKPRSLFAMLTVCFFPVHEDFQEEHSNQGDEDNWIRKPGKDKWIFPDSSSWVLGFLIKIFVPLDNFAVLSSFVAAMPRCVHLRPTHFSASLR